MKDKEQKRKGTSPVEDRCQKMAAQGFKDVALSKLGIERKLKIALATESVDLHIVQMFSDFNFLDEEDEIVHVEFESSNPGKAGLKRNRIREAILSQQYDKPVTTYVVFTGNVKRPMSEFSEGINTYRIKTLSMWKHNANKIFRDLQERIESGDDITQEDITQLLITPFMNGSMTQYERISQALQISKDYIEVFGSKYSAEIFQAILYAYADKFLDEQELEKIKEVLNMTKLGQMLIEDGENRAKAQIVKNLLSLQLSYNEIAEVVEMDIEFVEEIAEELKRDKIFVV